MQGAQASLLQKIPGSFNLRGVLLYYAILSSNFMPQHLDVHGQSMPIFLAGYHLPIFAAKHLRKFGCPSKAEPVLGHVLNPMAAWQHSGPGVVMVSNSP